MTSTYRSRAAALLLVAAACKSRETPTATQEPLASSTTTVATTAAPLLAPTGSAMAAIDAGRPAKRPDAKPLSSAQQKTLRSAIAEGRLLGKAGKWNEAVAVFFAVPETLRDGVLLSELCYAAYKDGQFEKAKAICDDARRMVHAPQLRAQVLFNSGLVEEAAGEWAEAVGFYEESLSLRANSTVAKRLEDAKKKKASKAPPENCDRTFPTLDDACACLVRRRTNYLSPVTLYGNVKGFCAPEVTPSLAQARSLRLAGSVDDEGNDMKFLFLAEGSGWKKMPVEVGNYEPGAFGVHNLGKLVRFEEKTVNGHPWLLIHATIANNDFNLGGLELYASLSTQVTPCQVTPKVRCGMTVSLKNTDSLSYEDRGEDMNPEEKREFDAMKKNEYSRTYETDLTLGEDGESYTVTLKSGDKAKLPPDLLGKHRL